MKDIIGYPQKKNESPKLPHQQNQSRIGTLKGSLGTMRVLFF